MVSTSEQMQVPNGTKLGVRRSKRPLLASCIRCNIVWKPPKFGNEVKYKKRLLPRYIHHFKSDLIYNIDHMHISGTEPLSEILRQTELF